MIRAGQITAFYLFDVAESIDLTRLRTLLPAAAESAGPGPKPAIPSYVKYQVPPLQIDATALGMGDLRGFTVRFKIFDYGVVSASLTRGFSGSWDDLAALAHQQSAETSLERDAEALCRALVDRMSTALQAPRKQFLSEDYFVYSVTALDPPMTAEVLIDQAGDAITRLLRGEQQSLSAQEREEIFRHRLSYLVDDLVVPTWSAALVYDTEPGGLHVALEILEYANSQLLQFRYYDVLLDGELARIYKELETTRNYRTWLSRRYTRAARHLHALFIDVNELTDRTENALKLVGDVYAARLLALANSRLGVTAWHDSVHEKLKTLDDIYHFAVDRTSMDRGEVLEMAIVGILIFELVLFFLGIMR